MSLDIYSYVILFLLINYHEVDEKKGFSQDFNQRNLLKSLGHVFSNCADITTNLTALDSFEVNHNNY